MESQYKENIETLLGLIDHAQKEQKELHGMEGELLFVSHFLQHGECPSGEEGPKIMDGAASILERLSKRVSELAELIETKEHVMSETVKEIRGGYEN